MALLESHLEQISLSSKAIAELPFPPPGKFTNALLGRHDITTLIRDTEAHERALFQLHSDANSTASRRSTRRGTLFGVENDGDRLLYPRQQSAVAQVLGGDMVREIERSTANARSKQGGIGKGINVEVLLQGAERLCSIYPVEGATAKITSLWNRYRTVATAIAQYETKVEEQTEQMGRLNRNQDNSAMYSAEEKESEIQPKVTEEDRWAEEQEIRELEARKRALEDRVAGMEKDLGGLMR